jgi:hypothetical protein
MLVLSVVVVRWRTLVIGVAAALGVGGHVHGLWLRILASGVGAPAFIVAWTSILVRIPKRLVS